MGYTYSVRGWMELSWPDAEFEGVDETQEEHADKVRRVHELLTTNLSPEELLDESAPARERYKTGWAFPHDALNGAEYIFFGADVEDPADVLALIKELLSIDAFADGYFSIEGEDGEQYRQWMIVTGKVYTRRQLFPDFDVKGPPEGYSLLFAPSSS